MVPERTASRHQPHLTSHNQVRTTNHLSNQSFSSFGGLVTISEKELKLAFRRVVILKYDNHLPYGTCSHVGDVGQYSQA